MTRITTYHHRSSSSLMSDQPSSMASESPQPEGQFIAPILGDEAQSLISCNQKLQELGIDDTIKLPRIVVIGDQSTGKSSLIEAISSIQVPKAAGLCTRCPIAINLSSGRAPAFDWECSVFIEEKYVYNTSNKQDRVSKAKPLGPWEVQEDIITTLIGTTKDRSKLIDFINAAQNRILNPNRRPQSLNESSTTKLQLFSPNIIRIDISIGNCPNLSFVDLPGVIQSAGKGQPKYYVDLVESLARTYARDENNIIINCLPIVHDVANSKAYSIVQQENAQSHTMAVFTKVDIAREEDRNTCLQTYFAEETEEEFEHGSHIVMLAGASVSNGNTTEAETAFFAQPLWTDLPEATQNRLGVRNLTSLLRKILFQKTADTLPENLQKIEARIDQVEECLAEMPMPADTTELPYQLREHILILATNVKQLFSGQEVAGVSSRNKLMEAMNGFNKQIQNDRPTMVIKSAAEVKQLAKAERMQNEGTDSMPVHVDDDEDEKQSQAPIPKSHSSPSVRTDRRARVFHLDEIRAMNKERYQSSIPGDIELKALEEMHIQSVRAWHITFDEFMQKVNKIIISEVINCVKATFLPHKHLPLYAEVVAATKQYVDDAVQAEWTHLQRHCHAEQVHPLTFDDANLRQAEMQSLTVRREKRAETRLEVERATRKANGLSSKKKVKEPSLDDIGPDPWDVEVQMASKTRAYYEIASHRFVDTVCQNILAHLIPLCHEALVTFIRSYLGLDDIANNRNRIVVLMTEKSEREAQRRRLLDELERLKAGHAYISNVLGSLNQQSLPAYNLFEDSVNFTAMDSENVANTPETPGKRKLVNTDFGSDISEFSSPSKRSQRNDLQDPFQAIGERQYRARLPSRHRSNEVEE